MTDEELGAWVRRLTKEKKGFYPLYHCSPEQYHAGIDKLWAALEITTTQDEDVFTLAARAIEEGKAMSNALINYGKKISKENKKF